MFFSLTFAQEGAQKLEVADCFDYYFFGSVKLHFYPELPTIAVGNKLKFTGYVRNQAGHPIVDGIVLAKIMRMTDFTQTEGPSIVADQFIAIEKISLAPNMQKEYSFYWQVPTYLKPGKYVLATYFIAEKKFNYSGLSFTEDVVGSLSEFSVVNNEVKEFVYFDRSKVFLNDKKHNFVGFIPEFGPTEKVRVKLSLVNETNEKQQIPIKWKLYKWDGADEQNLLKEKNELIQINAKETKELGYTITETNEPVFYLMVEANYNDAKSILGIRFARAGIDKVRINSPGIYGYPIEKQHFSKVFTCVHGMNESPVVNDNKLIMELVDKEGKVLGSWFYEGPITGSMMGLVGDVKTTDFVSNFTIKSKLYHKNMLVDSSTLNFNCKEIDPTKCEPQLTAKTNLIAQQPKEKQKDNNGLLIWFISAAIIFLIIVVTYFLFMQKPKEFAYGILLFSTITLIFFTSIPNANAETKIWSYTTNKYQVWGNTDLSDNVPDVIIDNTNIQITYEGKTEIEIDPTNKAILKSGSIVKLNAPKKLIFTPTDFGPDDNDADKTIYWTTTGKRNDSPFGYWKINAVPPSGDFKDTDRIIDSLKLCTLGWSRPTTPKITDPDYLPQGYIIQAPYVKKEKEIKALFEEELPKCFQEGGSIMVSFYTPVSVNPPKVTITHEGTAPRSCNADGTECTITGTGELITKFIFSSTTGNLYVGIQIKEKEKYDYRIIENFQVPEIVIEHKVTFEGTLPANAPPTTPNVSPCGTTIYQGDIINYTATSTDPDNDKIRFQIDWDNDGIFDMFAPEGFSVNSGQGYSFGKMWTTPGLKTFKVRAEDQYANTSNWATCSTNVLEYKATATCGTGKVYEEITLTANVIGGQGPYTYEWTQLTSNKPVCEIVYENNNIAKIRCNGDGQKEVLLTVTDSQNRKATATTKCLSWTPSPYCFVYLPTGQTNLATGNNTIKVGYANFRESPEGIQQPLYCGNGQTTILSCYNSTNEAPYNGDCTTTCNYNVAGNYTVSSNLDSENDVEKDVQCIPINVNVIANNQPPTCSFTTIGACNNTNGTKTFTFKNTSTDDIGIASGKINFGDGHPIYEYFTKDEEVEHSYNANSGTKTIEVEVTDNQGLTSTCSTNIDTSCTGSEPICTLKLENTDNINKTATFSITANNIGTNYSAIINYDSERIQSTTNPTTEDITSYVNSNETFTHDYSDAYNNYAVTSFVAKARITNNDNGLIGECQKDVVFTLDKCKTEDPNYICVSSSEQCTNQYSGIVESDKVCPTAGLF
ncbi:MAG: hypothetical protein QXX06_03320, partial [Candidatus Diapherotrites archaeon]